MENDYSKISPTAIGQANLKSLCGISYAKEIRDLADAGNIWGIDEQAQKDVVLFTETRYKGTDRVLQKYIKEQKITQVLELASGLSPEGISICEKYPDVKYLETDLEQMLESKKKIIADLGKKDLKNLYFAVADALNLSELEKALDIFDKNKELIITATGLLSYLTIEEKKLLAENVKKILSKFGGFFITPDLSGHKKRREGMYIDKSSQAVFEDKIKTATTRGYDENAFENEEETDKFYKNLGFKIEKFHQFEGYELDCVKNLHYEKGELEKILQNIKDYGKVWVFSI